MFFRHVSSYRWPQRVQICLQAVLACMLLHCAESIVRQSFIASMRFFISAIRRKENGWYDENHPLVFLFLGSSGIGEQAALPAACRRFLLQLLLLLPILSPPPTRLPPPFFPRVVHRAFSRCRCCTIQLPHVVLAASKNRLPGPPRILAGVCRCTASGSAPVLLPALGSL